MTVRHLLEIDDLSAGELALVLDLAATHPVPALLDGRGVALVFEKPSARTRNATEMAVVQLGGHPLSIAGGEIGIGTRESPEDLARTLACYHAIIGARVFRHGTLQSMAAALDAAGVVVPVVNLLSDTAHPCQALADLLTLREAFGRLEGLTVTFVGDSANNVATSLALACAMSGVRLRTASPAGYGPEPSTFDRVAALGGVVEHGQDPYAAVVGAHAIYTDVWTSMGDEGQAADRRAAFAGFTVDDRLVAAARPDAIVLHCLPAKRGEEITASVIEGERSAVFRQAANRMHAMRGLLWWLAEHMETAR